MIQNGKKNIGRLSYLWKRRQSLLFDFPNNFIFMKLEAFFNIEFWNSNSNQNQIGWSGRVEWQIVFHLVYVCTGWLCPDVGYLKIELKKVFQYVVLLLSSICTLVNKKSSQKMCRIILWNFEKTSNLEKNGPKCL